jgi:hypothetical protein
MSGIQTFTDVGVDQGRLVPTRSLKNSGGQLRTSSGFGVDPPASLAGEVVAEVLQQDAGCPGFFWMTSPVISRAQLITSLRPAGSGDGQLSVACL